MYIEASGEIVDHIPPDPANIAVVILAAGKGTRMRSKLPKVLHPLLGEPMIYHLLRAVRHTGIPPERTAIVVGYSGEEVANVVKKQGNYLIVYQDEQLGTGHAVKCAENELTKLENADTTHVLVLLGDGPLVKAHTLNRLIQSHLTSNPLVTLVTTEAENPYGYGRIIRDGKERFCQIIEEAELLPQQRNLKEINPSLYLFQGKWLWENLRRLEKHPAKGEYYLTDLPAMALKTIAADELHPVQTMKTDFEEVLGINDRVQLAEAEIIMRHRVLRQHMLNGVTIVDTASTYISATARIEADTILEPNTHIRGKCIIKKGCVIGPNTILVEATIGENCVINASMVENSTLKNNVSIGPFSHVRPGCMLEEGVYMGNFAEVSRAHIGADSKQSHFSFIGDATLGKKVNVGAGTITANYDGKNKNKTIIGDNVFIGSDSILRAPLTLGDDATTGAGSIVTKNVEPGVTVVGMPARPIRRKSVSENTENKEE